MMNVERGSKHIPIGYFAEKNAKQQVGISYWNAEVSPFLLATLPKKREATSGDF